MANPSNTKYRTQISQLRSLPTNFPSLITGSNFFSLKETIANISGFAKTLVGGDFAATAGKQPWTVHKGMSVAVFQQNLIYEQRNLKSTLCYMTPLTCNSHCNSSSLLAPWGGSAPLPSAWAPAAEASGPWTAGSGQGRGGTREAGSPGGLPDCIPGWPRHRGRHSLRNAGNAGTDEGHSSSATRRTKGFMGVVRNTPPCDRNVLGPPGRGREARKTLSVADSPTSGPTAPPPATVVPSAPAQRAGSRARARARDKESACGGPPDAHVHLQAGGGRTRL